MASRDFSIADFGNESALLPGATYVPLLIEAATFWESLTVVVAVAPVAWPARKLPELMLFELDSPVTPTSGTSELMKA
jgi:hypothetical protein